MKTIAFFFLLLALMIPVARAEEPTHLLEPAAFDKFRTDHPEAQLIDVRTAEEYKEGRIPGATNLDFFSNLKDQLALLDKTKTYMVYCAVGGRSSLAVELMNEMGFKSVRELKGGFNLWKSESRPIMKD